VAGKLLESLGIICGWMKALGRTVVQAEAASGPAHLARHGMRSGREWSFPVSAEFTVTMTTQRTIAIATPDTAFEELDFRSIDGIEVSLLWDRRSNGVLVVVHDKKRGACFEVPVLPGQRALEVFHHPFAYQRASSTPEPDEQAASHRGAY
jgi:hypothetical protein